MQYKNIRIIGTSHIARQSVEEIRSAILLDKPDIVALELDMARFRALFEKKRKGPSIGDIKRIGLKGYLFALIGGHMQRKLGNIVDVEPGADMKTASVLAKKNSIRIALIDRQIDVTLKRFSEEFSWKEKWQLVKDIFSFKREKIDLSRVPEKELIQRFTKEVKKKYPGVYRALIDERNHHMARNIETIVKQNPEKKILVVVGAGHEEAILQIVKNHLLQTGRM